MIELLPVSKNSLYLNRYIRLIEYSKNRQFTGYTEKHHILPKSMFPEYSKNTENLVVVSARVHFILHYLLWKAYRNHATWNAFKFMNSKSKNHIRYMNSKLYASLKESNLKMRQDHRSKISNSLKGIKRSNETKEKMKISNKINGSKSWSSVKHHTDETKEKMSLWQKDKPKPEVSGSFNGKSKQITFNGISYGSISECSRLTGLSSYHILKSI